jgi:hypothetical protein
MSLASSDTCTCAESKATDTTTGLPKFVEVLHAMVCDEKVPCIHWSPCGRYVVALPVASNVY